MVRGVGPPQNTLDLCRARTTLLLSCIIVRHIDSSKICLENSTSLRHENLHGKRAADNLKLIILALLFVLCTPLFLCHNKRERDKTNNKTCRQLQILQPQQQEEEG